MTLTNLAFLGDIAGWQWAIAGVAAVVVIVGVVIRQIQRKKAGL